ncbi:MAG TPA: ABC transporter permease subunit [Blastocatellia bacterium]|nr:ABC transporter permease subunit [Blastocatellia bacterium]
MLTQLRIEFSKLIRSKGFYLSLLALVGFVTLMLWGYYSYSQRKAGGGQAVAQFKYTYESRSYFNGLTFALYSVIFSFSLLIPVFVAMTAGASIAGEARAGTLRMICVRPVSRVTIFLSKFLIVAVHIYLLMAFFIALNLLVGYYFGWDDLELFPGPLNLVDEPGRIERGDALWRFLYASFSGTWALLVVAALAMLFSVLFESSSMAVVTTLAIYIMLYIIGRIEFFEDLRPYFFTTDMDFWRDVFKPVIPWRSFLHYGSICGAYIFGTLLVAVTIFDRKDITT